MPLQGLENRSYNAAVALAGRGHAGMRGRHGRFLPVGPVEQHLGSGTALQPVGSDRRRRFIMTEPVSRHEHGPRILTLSQADQTPRPASVPEPVTFPAIGGSDVLASTGSSPGQDEGTDALSVGGLPVGKKGEAAGGRPPGSEPPTERGEGEGDPRRKPFSLFHIGREFSSIPSLQEWGEGIEVLLDEHQTGKIAIILGSNELTQGMSKQITRDVDEGMKPSDAISNAWGRISRGGRFDYDKAMLLDDLAQRYPGRLRVVHEWRREEVPDGWQRLNVRGNLTEAELEVERRKIYGNAFLTRERNERMKGIITEVLAGEDVVAGVGLAEVAQPEIGYSLIDDGYQVSCFIPEGQEGKIYYSPINMLLVTAAHRQDKFLTTHEINLAYQAELRAQEEFARNGNQDEQGVIRNTQEWLVEQLSSSTDGASSESQADIGLISLAFEASHTTLSESADVEDSGIIVRAGGDIVGFSSIGTIDEGELAAGEVLSPEIIAQAAEDLRQFARRPESAIADIETAEDLDSFLGTVGVSVHTLLQAHMLTRTQEIYDRGFNGRELVGLRYIFNEYLGIPDSDRVGRVRIISEDGRLAINVQNYKRVADSEDLAFDSVGHALDGWEIHKPFSELPSLSSEECQVWASVIHQLANGDLNILIGE